MKAVVRTDGTPSDIGITKSLDTNWPRQASRDRAQPMAVRARLKDGKPVPVRITIEMRFTLKK
jgi:Gram-negative bacterial tonB protein.